MKKIIFFIFFIFSNIVFTRGVHINLGPIVGLVAKVYGVQVLEQMQGVKELIQVTQQTENQLRQIQQQAENMASLGQDLTTGQLNYLQNSLQNMLNIKDNMISDLNKFNNLNSEIGKLYNENLEGLNPDEITWKSNRLIEQSKNLFEDAMKISQLGNLNNIKNDSNRIKQIMSVANSAKGQKQVLQATTQLSSMELKILNEQKILMSQSLKAQSAYFLKNAQEQELEKAQAKDMHKRNSSLSAEGKTANVFNREW